MNDGLQFGDLLMDNCRRFLIAQGKVLVLLICLFGLHANAILAQGSDSKVDIDFSLHYGE